MLGKEAFKVKRIGMLTMGIGSALDEKYLILFEGPTAADDDDMVVEAKQIRDLQGNPCVRTDVGASRVLDGMGLIAYEPFAYAAVVPHGDKRFWMHDWTDDYQEALIGTMMRTPKDLRQIAFDAGVQMGRAHPKRPDGGPDKDRQPQGGAQVARSARAADACGDEGDGGTDRRGVAGVRARRRGFGHCRSGRRRSRAALGG